MKYAKFFFTLLLSMSVCLAGAADLSDAKWYTIKVGNGGYLSTGAEYMNAGYLTLSNTTKDMSDNGLWTYVGNDTEGYSFYNKAKGGSYVLGMTGTEAQGRAQMVTEGNTANVTKFDMGQNGTGFWIKDHGTDHKYWNKRGDFLAYWDSSAGSSDTGSRFIMEIGGVATEFCVGKKGSRPADIHDFSLWYDMPATATGVSDTWMEYALPMGNGQIGATIRGGVMTDDIQFNEKTLWSGYATNGSAVGQGYFQNLGSILVKDKSGTFSAASSDNKPIENYNRYLDIIDGVAGVNFQSDNIPSALLCLCYRPCLCGALRGRRYRADGTGHLLCPG